MPYLHSLPTGTIPRSLGIPCRVLVSTSLAFWVHSQAAVVSLPGHQFTVPDGFTVERVAGPPLVDRPVHVDFDDEGGLYVADSSGSNAKVEKQLAEKPHRLVRLGDTNGDGVFDSAKVFADKMMFPEGMMVYNGSVYVGAPPSIWKLTDTDGDGIANVRTEWFQPGTLTGCANDLHGPYMGLDGRIYWAKGAFARQRHDRSGQPPLITRAAHLFRTKPDASDLDAVMTGGMDNPVEVAFLPNGERFFTTTFVHQPEAGKRDGVVHAVYGGLYGKVNDVLDDHKKTGDLLPVMVMFGPAAPAGLMRYESEVLGKEYKDNLFAALFNLHKVTRHRLIPNGATYQAVTEDFLVSDNPDFHPTDVIEDADGSILVVDTGGWYKICCPTSQLAKPDVLGAIYRVRRTSAQPVADPRGRDIAWNQIDARGLVALLGDPRPPVRRKAIHRLGLSGAKSVPALRDFIESGAAAPRGTGVEGRRNAVWALARIETEDSQAAVRSALEDPSLDVRHVAAHVAGLWRDRKAVTSLLNLLRPYNPGLCRAAAEALGRIGDASAVPALLDAAGHPMDRMLEHSLIYALIEINDRKATLPGLKAGSVGTRKAALIALDQMDQGGVDVEDVLPCLAAEPLKDTATWILARHSEWGGAVARHLHAAFRQSDLSPANRLELESLAGKLAGNPAMVELIRELAASERPLDRVSGLRAMSRAGMKTMPKSWVDTAIVSLELNHSETKRAALGAIRNTPPGKEHGNRLGTALLSLGAQSKAEDGLRLESLAMVPGGLTTVSEEIWGFLKSQLAPTRPAMTRSGASQIVSRAKLSREQLVELAGILETSGPMEIGRLVAAFAFSNEDQPGLAAIKSLKNSKGLAGLRAEQIKPHFVKYSEQVRAPLEELANSLDVSAAEQRSRLEKMLGEVQGGDVRRGQAIFNSAKAACASCHSMGYLGGKFGPDLTRIGEVRNERDLLESIVFPSASFVRSYEPILVSTTSGDLHSGLLLRDGDTEIVVGTAPDASVRLARSEIAEMRPGTVSLMPQGLDEQLSRQELADLLAFLKNTRWGAQ